MEFVKTLKQVFKIQRADSISYTAVSAIGGIAGIIIVLIIMAVEGSGEDYGKIGSLMSLLLGTLVLVFGGIFSVQSEFNLAVSMGKTRQYFIPARYITLIVNAALVMGITMLVSFVEGHLYPAVYPGAVCELEMGSFLSRLSNVVFFVFGMPMLVLLFGALLMRFTTKFFWVIWVLWMAGCTGIPRVIDAAAKQPESALGRIGLTVAEFFEEASDFGMLAAIAVLIAAGMTVTMMLFRRQRVTS